MKNYIAKLKQGGIIVAQVDAHTKEQAEKEINHYAMIYLQDGEVEIVRSCNKVVIQKGIIRDKNNEKTK